MVGFDNSFASYRYSRLREDSLYIDIVYLWFVAVERRRPIKFIEVPQEQLYSTLLSLMAGLKHLYQ